MAAHERDWLTPRREDVLRRLYPIGTPYDGPDGIRAALAALPGLPLPVNVNIIGMRAYVLGLRRPRRAGPPPEPSLALPRVPIVRSLAEARLSVAARMDARLMLDEKTAVSVSDLANYARHQKIRLPSDGVAAMLAAVNAFRAKNGLPGFRVVRLLRDEPLPRPDVGGEHGGMTALTRPGPH